MRFRQVVDVDVVTDAGPVGGGIIIAVNFECGTLARDGTGDFDGDGQTDLQEFLAGTDPTNTGSVLRVLALNLLGNGATKLIWSTAPGKTYRVQFKDSIDAGAWNYLPGAVVANATTATLVDSTPTADSHRFYRAILIP